MDAPSPSGVGRVGGGRDEGRNPARGARGGRRHLPSTIPRTHRSVMCRRARKPRRGSIVRQAGSPGGTVRECGDGPLRRSESERGAPVRETGSGAPSAKDTRRASKRRAGRAQPMRAHAETVLSPWIAAQPRERAAPPPRGGRAGRTTPEASEGPRRSTVHFRRQALLGPGCRKASGARFILWFEPPQPSPCCAAKELAAAEAASLLGGLRGGGWMRLSSDGLCHRAPKARGLRERRVHRRPARCPRSATGTLLSGGRIPASCCRGCGG
jgi:hypothetical protein